MASQIKFYLDEHVQTAVAKALRRRAVDVLTIRETGRTGLSDAEQLAFASHQSRVMVTMDSDFMALAAQGALHAGIVYVPSNRSIREIIRGLMLIHDVLEPIDMVGHVEYL